MFQTTVWPSNGAFGRGLVVSECQDGIRVMRRHCGQPADSEDCRNLGSGQSMTPFVRLCCGAWERTFKLSSLSNKVICFLDPPLLDQDLAGYTGSGPPPGVPETTAGTHVTFGLQGEPNSWASGSSISTAYTAQCILGVMCATSLK